MTIDPSENVTSVTNWIEVNMTGETYMAVRDKCRRRFWGSLVPLYATGAGFYIIADARGAIQNLVAMGIVVGAMSLATVSVLMRINSEKLRNQSSRIAKALHAFEEQDSTGHARAILHVYGVETD
jgi:hypothetical protein